ncbi:MAG TPA: ATP-binding protein, partial [Methylomirabilota bacterium]|nr:ATP-binding protein [Methylomirabilota bacterium]
ARGACPAVLVVPLLVEGRAVGALAIGDVAGRRYTAEETQVAQAFADHAAAALRNSELYAELRSALHAVQASQQKVLDAERMRATGELAAGVAHHVNNLLMVILGHLQLALPRIADPGALDSMRVVEQAVLDGARVLGRVQTLTAEQALTAAGSVDLNALAHEALELTRPQWEAEAQARGRRLEVSFEAGKLPPVMGEPLALREALANLVLNAVDALHAGGTIAVRSWATPDSVYCSVADTGTGMAEATRRRALEPFFTTRGPSRLGLGLSVAYWVLRRHRGALELESVEGEGTVVRLRLPRQGTGR